MIVVIVTYLYSSAELRVANGSVAYHLTPSLESGVATVSRSALIRDGAFPWEVVRVVHRSQWLPQLPSAADRPHGAAAAAAAWCTPRELLREEVPRMRNMDSSPRGGSAPGMPHVPRVVILPPMAQVSEP